MDFILKILKFLYEIRIEFINIVLLYALVFYGCTLIKNKRILRLLAVFLSVFLCLQLISLYFVQTFIGYQFYVHFNLRDVSGMLSIYWVQILLLVGLFTFITYTFVKARQISFFLQRVLKGRIFNVFHRLPNRFFKIFGVILLLISTYFMIVDRGMIHSGMELYKMLYTEDQNLQEALKTFNVNNYVLPKDIKAKKGKNILIISLESLERGYLEGDLSHLTPNLNQLKKKWTYFDMQQNPGSDWTSGSLYTSFTGLPAYFGVHGNDIFQKSYHSDITGIPHILNKLGYNQTYITSSDSKFSGTQELLHTFGIKNVIDQSSNGQKFRDKDLFKEAYHYIQEKNKNNQHFALYLSTFDTHFPNGVYDERMEEFISPKSNKNSFMVAAVDYMIGELIRKLSQDNLLDNTIVYIFPDHLKMGASLEFRNSRERSLYVLTNAKKEHLKKTDSLYQIDLPNIILDGAEIKHNATFGGDWMPNNKEEYIKEHLQEFTILNTSGILRLNTEEYQPLPISQNYNQYKTDTSRFIAHAGGKIDRYTYTNSLEALNHNYAKGYRLFELDIIKTSDNQFVAAHDWDHWSKISQYKGETPVDLSTFLQQRLLDRYTPMDMKAINSWFSRHPDATLITDKVNTPKGFADQFVDSNRLMMELFSMDAIKEGLKTDIKSVIVSQNVLEKLGRNAPAKLKELNISHVAISRTFIEDNKDLLRDLKENGIKVYAYHINFGMQLGEKYTVKYEMDHIYGIYSDDWNFGDE